MSPSAVRMNPSAAASASYKGTAGSRVLIVGATGFIGGFLAEASIDSGRPTYLLVRPGGLSNPKKAATINALQAKGAVIVHGEVNDKELMENIMEDNKIEIVISVVGGGELLDQLPLVEAIKAVGTIKRFLPSEFGHDVDRADPVEPGLTMYKEKRIVRRLVEQYGIPYTYICCNSIASWPYFDNKHPSEVLPPLDQFQIYGDGTVKAYFVHGTDIGKFTMKAVEDVHTVNKSVHFQPHDNCYNMNDLASLWEKKIGRLLPRVTVTEDHLLAVAAENSIPKSIVASFTHDIFIRGCQVNFTIDDRSEVEVSKLYPEEPFKTIDECFAEFLLKVDRGQEENIVAPAATIKEEEEVVAAPAATKEEEMSATIVTMVEPICV